MSLQKEDVYETSDLPETDQHLAQMKEERFDSDQIERIHVDVSDAFNKFKGKVLSADDVDFSDSLAKRRRVGYGSGAYVLELLGGSLTDACETPEQKFNRLQCEIEELTQQLTAIQEEGKEGSGIGGNDVMGLQQRLKSMQIEQILAKRADLSVIDPQAALAQKLSANIDRLKKEKAKEDGSSKEVFVAYNLTHPGIDSDQKLVSLESRIKHLESCLRGSSECGQSEQISDMEGKSLGERVELLQQRIQMQDPSYLEGIEARLNAILQKYNKIQEKKGSNGDESEEGKRIDELYELMTKWDGQAQAVPKLAQRLQSLQTLHEQAMQFSQMLTQLEGGQQQLTKLLETDAKLLTEAKTGMAANMEQLKKMCENMEGRLKALGK